MELATTGVFTSENSSKFVELLSLAEEIKNSPNSLLFSVFSAMIWTLTWMTARFLSQLTIQENSSNTDCNECMYLSANRFLLAWNSIFVFRFRKTLKNGFEFCFSFLYGLLLKNRSEFPSSFLQHLKNGLMDRNLKPPDPPPPRAFAFYASERKWIFRSPGPKWIVNSPAPRICPTTITSHAKNGKRNLTPFFKVMRTRKTKFKSVFQS